VTAPGDPGARPGGLTTMAVQVRATVATGLLAALSVAWAALPTGGARGGLRAALVVAASCAAASLGRLALGDLEVGGRPFDGPLTRLAAEGAHLLRSLPWAETMLVAVLILEALHPSRPWHTALLGLALLAFLLAAHLAESGSRPSVYRPQLPVIAAGLGLLALAVGAAALPLPPAGPAADLLRAAAVVAAVIAAALALPTR
jgi:hypothetical protein